MVAYVVKGARFRALRAREAGFFSCIKFFYQDGQLILMVRSSKQLFYGGLCSKRSTFPRTAGARAREAGFFFIIVFYLPIRFQ